MDENLELLLQKARRTHDWEDEERANYDHETLRQEFRKRLYGDQTNGGPERQEDRQVGEKE